MIQPPALGGWLVAVWATLPQPLSFHIVPEPGSVVGLTAEAKGLRCEVLGLLGRNATLMDVDGHPFLEGLDVRD